MFFRDGTLWNPPIEVRQLHPDRIYYWDHGKIQYTTDREVLVNNIGQAKIRNAQRFRETITDSGFIGVMLGLAIISFVLLAAFITRNIANYTLALLVPGVVVATLSILVGMLIGIRISRPAVIPLERSSFK